MPLNFKEFVRVFPSSRKEFLRALASSISVHFSSPSKEFLRALALACEVSEADLPQFAYQLAEERNGLSLVYMHHADSLKSGHSYQNDARMSLRDHLEVGTYSCCQLSKYYVHAYDVILIY